MFSMNEKDCLRVWMESGSDCLRATDDGVRWLVWLS